MARILIIDDSPTIVAALREILAADGHEVERLEVFSLLPHVLSADPPDLIVLDLELPLFSGIEFGRIVRRHQSRPIAILIHSSRPDAELAHAAREVAAVGWIRKGVPVPELRSAVAAALCAGEAR